MGTLSTLSAGKPVSVETAVGLSYNALSSPYVTPQDVITRYPILTQDAVQVMRKKEITNQTLQAAGSSLYEVAQSFSVAVSASAKYMMFSGTVSSEFGHEQASSSESAFYKLMNISTRIREYLNGGDAYRNHLHPQFVADLASLPVKKLFDKYGTHLITEACFGGRLEMNFTYQKNRTETTDSVKASIEAAYGDFSTKVSSAYKNSTNHVVANSDINIRSVGGASVGFSSIDSFLKQYEIWVDSLNKEENWEFCGIPNKHSLVPLWELCDNDTRRGEIEAVYIELANQNGALLMADDLYVKEICFVSSGNAHQAKLSCPNGYILVDKDLNAGAGGTYIYLCYKLGKGKAGAITNCVMTISGGPAPASSGVSLQHSGKTASYVRDGLDLNQGAGGQFIYFYYTQDKAYAPCKRLEVIFENENIAKEWEPVHWAGTAQPADCNKSVGGKYIYVMMKRER